MSTQSLIESHRAGADIYTGAALCKQKSSDLRLPNGLLPLSDLDEVGYNRSTGFFWLRSKISTVHTFAEIGRPVSYGPEVTAFVEERRMKRMTGVKSKEMMLWVTLSEMFVDGEDPGKITFRTPAGLSRRFRCRRLRWRKEGDMVILVGKIIEKPLIVL